MKKKISICIDEQMIAHLEVCISDGTFRSRSHLIEYALNQYINKRRDESHDS